MPLPNGEGVTVIITAARDGKLDLASPAGRQRAGVIWRERYPRNRYRVLVNDPEKWQAAMRLQRLTQTQGLTQRQH